MSCGCYVISSNIGALKEVGDIYGVFINMEINDDKEHPYYESINKDYINKVIETSVNVIEDYKNNSTKLEKHLNNQINFIKTKYKINLDIFNLY